MSHNSTFYFFFHLWSLKNFQIILYLIISFQIEWIQYLINFHTFFITVGKLFGLNSSRLKNFPLLGGWFKSEVVCIILRFKRKCVKVCFISPFFNSQVPSIGGSSVNEVPHSEDGRLSIPPRRPFAGLTSVSIAPSTLSTK